MDKDFIGIYHPAHANRFMVRYIFNESSHDMLSRQTISADYDLTSKSLNIVIEMPLGQTELMDDLIQLSNLELPFHYISDKTCIAIDYLDGVSSNGAHSVHCFLERVESCRVNNDYAGTGTTKIYLDCKVRQFMVTGNSAYGK